MSQLVTLKLGWGNLQSGFPAVTALLGSETNPQQMQILGSLPPEPDLVELYKRWQLLYKYYYDMLSGSLRINFTDNEAEVVNFSELEFRELCDRFLTRFNTWLRSESFLNIREQLSIHLVGSEQIQVLIETEDIYLRRFPWNFWNFIKSYPQAEIALSATEFKSVKNSYNNQTEKVRILAVLGNSKGIDIQKDRELLQNLQDAKTDFLVEPSRNDIDNLLWEKAWDIFFFAGHSYGEIGIVSLDENRNLRIEDLENALRRAVAQGLKLAIFNSCDGLGIASKLENWYIPQIIVMREPVPDLVAQEFLKAFLKAFASGKSLYLSVREARERLQGLEDKYPCASWLPVICQNPAEVPPTWNKLRGTGNLFSWHNLKRLLVISAIATSLVMGVRALGWLQTSELHAYDRLMQVRPKEDPDRRILIVEINDADIERWGRIPISDRVLFQALEKLNKLKPLVIGLDIFRDKGVPEGEGRRDLAKHLAENKRLIVACKMDKPPIAGTQPLPEITPERLGFTNAIEDDDNVLRRHLLAQSITDGYPCKTDHSLNLWLARRYLESKGINEPKNIDNNSTIEIDKAIFKALPFAPPVGGYQKMDGRGFQILLNYRASNPIAKTVTLTEVLEDKVPAELVKGKIILIGYTGVKSASDDLHLTPYSTGHSPTPKMPGVIIQAHKVSQIISAVEDKRKLLGIWPFAGEFIWVWLWSVIGGIIVLFSLSPLRLVLAIVVALATLHGVSLWLLIQGSWVPFVPSQWAFVATSVAIIAYTKFQNQHQKVYR